MKCSICGSDNCKEESAYWSDGEEMVKVIRCKDCDEYSDK